jgi:hypothetical protein
MHMLVAYEFLTCKTKTQGRSRYLQTTAWTSLSSMPADERSETDCKSEQTVVGSDCYTVNGGMTVGLDASTTTEDLYAALGDFLSDSKQLWPIARDVPNVTSVVFSGFTNHETVNTAPEDTANVVAAAQQTPVSDTTDPALVGGGFAIAVAAVGLMLVGALIVKRRRSYYRKQDDDSEAYSLGVSETKTREFPVEIVNDMDEVDSVMNYAYEEEHDPATCVSTTCRLCMEDRMRRPTFIKADLLSMEVEIARDLGVKRSASTDRDYHAPNTVDL